MARKTSTVPTRIYTFGVGRTPMATELIQEQLRAAKRYQNALVAIERERREKYDAILAGSSEATRLLAERVALLTKEFTEAYALERQCKSRPPGVERTQEMREAQRTAVENRKRLAAELKEVRSELSTLKREARTDPVVVAALGTLHEATNGNIRAARKTSNVYWGTYLLIEAAMDAARKEKTPPKFKRFDGCGRLGVQFNGGGTPISDVFSGKSKLLQITPVAPEVYELPRGQRRVQTRTQVLLRVGSSGSGNREPQWLRLDDVILHRPIPEDAVVRWAWLKVYRVGLTMKYSLQLTLEAKSFDVAPRGRGVVAIDVGWRRHTDGAPRVAMAVGDTDEVSELNLDPSVEGALNHSDMLRSTRTKAFNEIRALVASKFPEQPTWPDWFKEEMAVLPIMKNPARLVRFVWDWRLKRFEGDDEIFKSLDAWRQQERHLYKWESHEAHRALGRRNEAYKLFAANLCRRYDTIVLEDFDLRVMVERESELTAKSKEQRRRRFRVSISALRQTLMAAAAHYGATIVKVKPKYSTLRCHVCGNVDTWDPAVQIWHTCSKCGVSWDQDINACRNLLMYHADDEKKSA